MVLGIVRNDGHDLSVIDLLFVTPVGVAAGTKQARQGLPFAATTPKPDAPGFAGAPP